MVILLIHSSLLWASMKGLWLVLVFIFWRKLVGGCFPYFVIYFLFTCLVLFDVKAFDFMVFIFDSAWYVCTYIAVLRLP